MSASRRMFGSLTSVGDKTAVVGQVQRRNARQLLPDERGHLEVDELHGALVASAADGAPAIHGRSVEYRSPDGHRRSEPTAAGSSVSPICGKTVSCSSPGGRKRTAELIRYDRRV